jgi:hypothetical protein
LPAKGKLPQKKWPLEMSPTAILEIGSPGRTRTSDKVVNSHLLYQLSYRGSVVPNAFAFAMALYSISLNENANPLPDFGQLF